MMKNIVNFSVFRIFSKLYIRNFDATFFYIVIFTALVIINYRVNVYLGSASCDLEFVTVSGRVPSSNPVHISVHNI